MNKRKITFKNYFDFTKGEFKLIESVKSTDIYADQYSTIDKSYLEGKLIKMYPKKSIQCNFISKKSIYFEVGKSKLVRISQHWDSVASCFWTLKNETEAKYKWKIGIISLKDFEPKENILFEGENK